MSGEPQENINAGDSDSQPHDVSLHSPIRSPASSPAASQVSHLEVSPPTSPAPFSPATSPLYVSPATSNDDPLSETSSTDSPIKRKRRSKTIVSRNTLRRLLRRDENERDTIEPEIEPVDVDNERVCAQSRFVAYEQEDEGDSNNEPDPEAFLSDEDSGSSSEAESNLSSDSDEGNRPDSPNSEASSAHTRSDDEADNNSDDEGFQSLYEGSEISTNDALYRVLKLYSEERWTKASLDKTVKLIKYLLPQPNEFPCSGKAALKALKELTVESYCEKEYQCCSECRKLVEGSDSCVHCGSHDLNKFYIFPPEVQIKHLFEQRDLASIIDSHRGQSYSLDGIVQDIQDASLYKSIKQNLNGHYDVVLLWNTDGVSLSKSSKEELWPILGTICEIPPRLRPSFMIVFGIFMGKHKPDMNVFLDPFVASLKKCFDDGVSWVHPVTKQNVISKIVAPFLCADAPAKAMVLNVMRFNARYGCNVCEQKTKLVELTPEELRENAAQPNPRKRIKRKRRFLYQEDLGPGLLRTGPRMNAQGVLAEERQRPRKGVLGFATVSEIPFFDRAQSVSAEYLHLVLLGPVKYFLHKMFFESGPWYIGNKTDEINQFIASIKVPDFVKRLPRGIDDFSYWKASEFRNFLLYYSAPLLKDFGEGRYFQHWLLLVASIHTLLKDCITDNDIKASEIMLRAFLRDVHSLYGPACYTYDVHNLIHLCLMVKRTGPLWATSAFPFESFNGFIAARLHGTKHLGKELSNNINISQSIAILKNIVNGEHRQQQSEGLVLLGKCYDKDILSDEEVAALSHGGVLENVDIYLRAKHVCTIYTSKLYDADKRRSNSFVEFAPVNNQTERYGEIVVFVKAENGIVYCLLRTFRVLHVHLLIHEESTFTIRNLVPVDYSGDFCVIPMENIISKVLKIGMYLGKRPNSVEVNL